jgi:hypothetical protein
MTTKDYYKKRLAYFGVNQSVLKKVLDIVKNNPDQNMRVASYVNTEREVSLYLLALPKFKQLVVALKRLSIHNIVCMSYDPAGKEWRFKAFSSKGRIFNTKVKRDECDSPLTYEEAVGVALIKLYNNIIAYRGSVQDHTTYLHDEISYDDTRSNIVYNR